MPDPGRLIGAGRDADIFDIGAGRVLRRYQDPARHRPDDVVREQRVMRHLRSAGFPVPEVFDVDGPDLVMEWVDGPTMLDELGRRPWRTRRYADTWADLHVRLAAVPVGELAGGPSALPVRFGAPDAILHLDFHPGNVIVTADGPIVIDWTNASLGPPAADVAQAWIIAASSTLDEPWAIRVIAIFIRRRLVDRFVDRCGRDEARALLPATADYRLRDRNVRPQEADRIRRLVAAHRTGPA